MKDVKFPIESASWDFYKAFHTFCGKGSDEFEAGSQWGANSPIVLFDTGEVIVTTLCPNPNQRGTYHSIGVRMTTTKNEQLYLPDGTQCAAAWLDDGGMQYLLVDLDSKRAVRLDGANRSAPHTNYYGKPQPGSPMTAGIPKRFQYNCRAYIPGPGLPPIAHEKIKVTRPIAKAGFTVDELEHINMIVATGQAAMKLTDHEATRAKATGVADPDHLLKCKTWQDVHPNQLPVLLNGAPRRTEMFDYLLIEKPE